MKSLPALSFVILLSALPLCAQVPQLLNYQGRVAVGNVNFNGTGQFRFALVNGAGTTTYWSNDGTSGGGSQPVAAVSLPVSRGLYSVQLGDSALANMTAIPNTVFNNPDVRVRVWFDDGVNGTELLSPDQRISAVGYAMMAGTVPDGAVTGAKLATGAVTSSKLAAGAVTAAKLSAGAAAANITPGSLTGAQLADGAAAANLNAAGQSAVASGGMVLSATENPALVSAGYLKLGTVKTSDVWAQRSSIGAPSARSVHSTVWTGTQMIVWGGVHGGIYFEDGGRYTPATDTWSAMSAPSPVPGRAGHSTVWTGTEMIVWGGFNLTSGYLNSGARYNPATNTWSTVSSLNAPSARADHTAVWTGTEMIIWGGRIDTSDGVNTGARYNPATNTWSPMSTSGSPVRRWNHTAVWTGSEMVVWGGRHDPASGPAESRDDGARYLPATDSWTSLLLGSSTLAARYSHSATWTGTEMLLWGGDGLPIAVTAGGGARWNPATSAREIQSIGAPGDRTSHCALWTGTHLLVWGGYDSINGAGSYNSGGLYNPATNAWTDTSTSGAPSPRGGFSAVWTGTEMLIWSGSTAEGTNDLWSYTLGRNLLLYQRP